MKIAYIAHPVAGNIKENLEKIRLIVRDINLNEPEVIPFAPYWIDCHALDDNIPEERSRGMRNNKEYFSRNYWTGERIIDELWLYGDKLSKGMLEEIALAFNNDIPVILKSENLFMEFFHFKKNYWLFNI